MNELTQIYLNDVHIWDQPDYTYYKGNSWE